MLPHFLDAHRRAGYEFVLPPHLLTYEAGYTAGQFPKFADEVFRTDDDHFLLPTAETALANLHRGETLDERELPRRYVAYTPCYRKESGSHRTAGRGTLRGHQFNKVELFQFARSQDSDAAHLELLARAEELVAGLGLHHRVTKLAAGDTSPAHAKTYDVEVWLPSLGPCRRLPACHTASGTHARRVAEPPTWLLPHTRTELRSTRAGVPHRGRLRRLAIARTRRRVARPSADGGKGTAGPSACTEVSSVSNARTYQARRGGIRYRPAGGGKAAYVHTLNAPGLATSRLLPAILEQHQRADGTVLVPEVLRRWGLPELLRPA
ncbi:aminoacyl--tRNA ligase-related protein [Streptomyces sp. NPDC008343]|uniref:aminoacyl--tRNA ligase-related protein n=1 Tax=Streptomyces sp. NPDC008343 TaxID=3364828 RepID=UPI0036E7845C